MHRADDHLQFEQFLGDYKTITPALCLKNSIQLPVSRILTVSTSKQQHET